MVLLRSFSLDKVRCPFGDLRELLLDLALVAKAARSAHKKARAHSGVQFSGLSRHYLRVDDEESALALVLEVGNVLLNKVLLTSLERLGEGDLLLTVEEHHGVESGHAWHVKVAIGEGATVAHSHGVRGEGLEALSILVGELVVLAVHCILLESNS